MALTLAIIQARTSSSRLPAKVMMEIQGRPMVLRQIERIQRCRQLDDIIVATSNDPSDDVLAELCVRENIKCYRGSLDDVLDRFYTTAKSYNADHLVRLTADCPLTDAEVIDRTVKLYCGGEYDYVSNTLTPSFPDGLDVEVFSIQALSQAWQKAELTSEREHVTPYIYKHPELFQLGVLKSDIDYSSMRWTVDEPEDLEFVNQVYDALYSQKPNFNYHDVLELLQQQPELSELNSQFIRNEGYVRSVQHDGIET